MSSPFVGTLPAPYVQRNAYPSATDPVLSLMPTTFPLIANTALRRFITWQWQPGGSIIGYDGTAPYSTTIPAGFVPCMNSTGFVTVPAHGTIIIQGCLFTYACTTPAGRTLDSHNGWYFSTDNDNIFCTPPLNVYNGSLQLGNNTDASITAHVDIMDLQGIPYAIQV